MSYSTGTLSLGKVIVEEIKRRVRELPVIDFGFVKAVNVDSSSELSIDFTVSVFLPDRDLTLDGVPVMSNMMGSGFGNVFLPKIVVPAVGQRCVIAFMNKQLEDPVVIGFVRNLYPVSDDLVGKTGSQPSDIEPNEWILRHKALGGSYDGTFAEVRIDKDNLIVLRQLNSSQVEQNKIEIKPNGEINISSAGSVSVTGGSTSVSGGTVSITGAPVIINSGTNGVARVGDSTSLVAGHSHVIATGSSTVRAG